MKKNWRELQGVLEQELAELTRAYRKRSTYLSNKIYRVGLKVAEQAAGTKPGDVLRYVKPASWVDANVEIGDTITVRKVAFSYHETRTKVWVNYRSSALLSSGTWVGSYFVTPKSLWRAFAKEPKKRSQHE